MSRSCEWVRARLARFLDGAPASDEQVAVEAHLDACADCRAALETRREMDRLVRDAAAPSPDRAETKSEAQALAALQAAMRRRYDLDAAAEAREREMAAERAGARARTMTPEEIAGAALDRQVMRETVAPGATKRRGAPTPVWRWLTLGVPVAAAAVVAVVLLVREPRMPEIALERALPTATREAPAPEAAATLAPAPAPPTTAPAPTAAPPAVTKTEPAPQDAGVPIEADEKATLDQPAAAVPAPSPPPTIDETVEAVTATAMPEGEPWTTLREFVEHPKGEGTADAGKERTTLLLAAEDRLLALTTAAAPSESEDRSRSSEKRPAAPPSGGGILGTLPHLRGGRSEPTGFRAQGADRANAPAEAKPAVERPPARLWLALADGWYLLYQGSRATANESDSGSVATASLRRDGAAAQPMDAPMLAARALVAYEQAAWVADSLSAEEQARVRERIAELKTRSRR